VRGGAICGCSRVLLTLCRLTALVGGGLMGDVRPPPMKEREPGLSSWSLVLGLHGCGPLLGFMI
jgi:hypothetical protein